jgi:16S rRNA (guanine(966)-N(2))-methyltransferase RsmD
MRRKSIPCFEVPIIGGEFKGKKILIPDVATTRSSKSILRESLFNTLQFEIIDSNFVEVFAGSGSVGLEALSRGAAHGYFIERNRDVFEVLQGNIHTLVPDRATTIPGDSFVQFPSLLKRLRDERVPTYFYFDPPFSIREDMEEIYDQTLLLIAQIDPTFCKKVVIEHMSKLKLPEQIGDLSREKQKRFGKSTLSYYSSDIKK